MSHPRNEAPQLCSAGDGTCEKPAVKGGLCWAHHKRKHRGGRPMAEPVKERTRTPLEGLFRAALEYKDELDTADDEEFQRGRERFRFALRRYLYEYVPSVLRKAKFTAATRAEVNAWLKTYGDKSAHGVVRVPKSNPQHRKEAP